MPLWPQIRGAYTHSIFLVKCGGRKRTRNVELRAFYSPLLGLCFSAMWHNPAAMKKKLWRAPIEIGFIIFLFYSNLLMGEYERTGNGATHGLLWCLRDIFTISNLEIGVIAAGIGYVLVEFLRAKF
jgi:hypothetical protein